LYDPGPKWFRIIYIKVVLNFNVEKRSALERKSTSKFNRAYIKKTAKHHSFAVNVLHK
jgi:CRISPR/Cas system-associated protein endoribonuclease Cas2